MSTKKAPKLINFFEEQKQLNLYCRPERRLVVYLWLAVYGLLLIFPRVAIAVESQAGRPYRVGVIALSRPFLRVFAGFWDGLGELGYRSGFDVTFSIHDLEKNRRQIPALVRRFAQENYDLILTMTTPVTKSVLKANKTVGKLPVLFTCVADPVISGIVKSLRRPNGRVSGISHLAFQLQAKRMQLFKTAFPNMEKIAVFYNPKEQFIQGKIFPFLAPVVQYYGLKIIKIPVCDSQQMKNACQQLSRKMVDGIFMVPDPLPVSNFAVLVAASRREKLPIMVIDNTLLAKGGIMGYSPDFYAVGYQLATMAKQVFNGVDPGRLPVQNPDLVTLVICLKEADKLHLSVSRNILLLADKVIK